MRLLIENELINTVLLKHLLNTEYHLDDGWWNLYVTITDVKYENDLIYINVFVKGSVNLDDDDIGNYDQNIKNLYYDGSDLDKDWFIEEPAYDLTALIADTFTEKYLNIGAGKIIIKKVVYDDFDSKFVSIDY